MRKFGKKYTAAKQKFDLTKVYSLEEAVKIVKETSYSKFDGSVDVSFNLNVNPTLADQLIRGTLTLPHGNGKEKKILVVTNTKQEEAKAAGADFVGGKEMIEKITTQNWFDFDVMVATPEMMAEIGKIGRVLGPKGLMPNPKTGTVTMDIATAVTEIKKGKIAYRVDKFHNLAMPVGKVSFDEEKLLDNLKVVTEAIAKARPSSVKGTYIISAAISATMGPAVKITFPGRN